MSAATAIAAAPPGGVRTSARAEAGKYLVPLAHSEWDLLAGKVRRYVADRKLIAPLAVDELRTHAAAIAEANGLPANHIEFLMIQLNNEVWSDVVASIPFRRRTLLLPPCLRSSTGCPASFDEFGLLCERCGRCDIGAISAEAEALGYAVLVAEGTSLVADLVRKGMIDAVIGVSCMPSLERAFPHIFTRAVPGIAIPLMKDGCQDTATCLTVVRQYLGRYDGSQPGLFPDLKGIHEDVQSWFQPERLRALMGPDGTETGEIALAWLAKSGKRWRPFLTVAVYRALCPGSGPVPDHVRNAAVALECMHKASLIYDDIQDDDDTRYGGSTVHCEQGVPVALTAALYLLGRGYRLLAESGADGAAALAMVRLATEGHCELSLGQGGELCWMRKPGPLTCAEVLEIFRRKTAPSFDVVFRLGAICGGAAPEQHTILKAYSEAIGVAYQIQDDLQDFKSGGDTDDIDSGRPSIVIAAAWEKAGGDDRRAIAEAWCGRAPRTGAALAAARDLVARHGGEDKALELLEEYKGKALHALRPLANRNLKILLHRVVGMVFDRA